MSGTLIRLEQLALRWREGNRETNFSGVKLEMSRTTAVLLFHDLNRMLGLLDAYLEREGHTLCSSDQGAYDRTNEVLAQLQRELGIEPQEG